MISPGVSPPPSGRAGLDARRYNNPLCEGPRVHRVGFVVLTPQATVDGLEPSTSSLVRNGQHQSGGILRARNSDADRVKELTA